MRIKMMASGFWQRIRRSKDPEPRTMVLFQRRSYIFSEAELRAAGERGWGKCFDGEEDPMYFVSHHPALTVVKAGPHIVRLTHIASRYAEDDEYALANLPQIEQKKAWNEHHAIVLLELFNDFTNSEKRIHDKDAYASLARLALHLGDPNCAAIFLPGKNWMLVNDGTAEEGLLMMIKKELPLG
jgi:hypothetical protein